MSKKDGKCTLIGAKEKRGFHSVIVGDDELDESLEAVKVCPVNIIKVVEIWIISGKAFASLINTISPFNCFGHLTTYLSPSAV